MTDALNGRVSRFEINEANFDAWLKAGAGGLIDFGGSAPVRSPAKLIADNQAFIEAMIAAAGGSAAGLNFLATGTGAYARSVQDKLNERKSLLDFVPPAERPGIVGGYSTYDATADFNRALDTMTSGVLEVRGTYRVSVVLLKNKSNFALDGRGAVLNTIGTANSTTKQGIRLDGTLTDVDVFGFQIICDGVEANRHAGIFSNSGLIATRVNIFRNYVKSGINGISLNANTSGKCIDCRIYGNHVDGTVGTDSGYGYGIHFADGNTGRSGVEIFANLIELSTRHAIYHAKGKQGRIHHNVIINHRQTVASGQIRSAINVLRSDDVVAENNYLIEPNDGGIYIGKAGVNGNRNIARHNHFIKTAASNNVPLIMVGSQDPTVLDPDIGDGVTTEGSPSSTGVVGNSFEVTGNSADIIRLYCGNGVLVSGNHGRRNGFASTAQAIYVRTVGGDAYNSDYTIKENEFDQSGSCAVIRWDDGFLGTTFGVRLSRNGGRSLSMFVGGAPNNPNISIFDQSVLGLSMASGVYANGRYQFKWTQASYDPANIAAASALGANFSVPNVKSGDFCHVNFGSIGASNVLISAQANSNNNVRVVFYNAHTAANDMAAGVLDILVLVNR